jgi:hypothetical protein
MAALALGGNAYAQSAQELEDQILARDDRIEALEQKLDTVVEELARVRTQVAVPDEPDLKSVYGFGPAASKIYGVERGLSIGGYGEFFYRNFIGDAGSGSDSVGGVSISDRQLDRADFLRLVTYLGYKFTDRIVFNSEIEFEHAKTGSSSASAGSGSVSVEGLRPSCGSSRALGVRTAPGSSAVWARLSSTAPTW